MDEVSRLRWYAVAVYARQEKAAARALAGVVDEVYLPVRVERRAWSDRVQSVELALFPGYLFVRAPMTPKQRIEILKPRQTADLVGRLPGDERVARAIPDEEIENLKTLVTKTSQLEPVERLVEGTRVLVAAGPLKGARGIVHRGPDGRRRLVAQIELLGRGVSAELCADDVVEEIE